jgi:phosphoribosylformylglycinamidine synthase
MVGAANASTNAPSDASVVLIKPTNKALAITVDCNSRYVYADPYKGAMIAVSEAARNIVCTGGMPLGVTNCLNFGNPYDPEVYYQFVEAIKGMGDACRRFETPVTGGNVSYYNQNPDGPVFPTPTIGMVGLLEDLNDRMTLDFKSPSALIYLLGPETDDLASSQYLVHHHGIAHSPAPFFEIEQEVALQQLILTLIKQKQILSAHDVSEGGVFQALCESSFPNGLGFSIQLPAQLRSDSFLFGESQSRVLVSVSIDDKAAFESALGSFPYRQIGVVTEGALMIDGQSWGDIHEWKELHEQSIHQLMTAETSL